MTLPIEVDIEKFRYSLVGDGYLYDEVMTMTEDKLLYLLEKRIHDHIEAEYNRSVPIVKYILNERKES